MADVRDILELERPATPEITKEAIIGVSNKQKMKAKKITEVTKRPEGMHRELYALLYSDNKDPPPLFPANTGKAYQQVKAKLGMRQVRPWKWMPFTNPARKDGATFYHWRRIADEGKDYPFAKFNKQIQVASYSDLEYQQYLHTDGWTREETDHLFDLSRTFDLRFIVIQDRWDRSQFKERSVEDLKERYYDIRNILARVRASPGHEPKMWVFDADHERKRKEQLKRLFDRTQEQIDEEQMLMSELRKIEARKKEREKKTQDLQKLITAADNQVESRRVDKKSSKKKLQRQTRSKSESTSMDITGIKFPDFKSSGVSLRSQRMKLPASVGQKKTKAIEQLLQELGIELNPMPTEEICQHFNELRSDMVLLYELKLALATCDFELQTLKHQYEAFAPGKTLDIPSALCNPSVALPSNPVKEGDSSSKNKAISEITDMVGPPVVPNKRKAALEQSNLLRKLKNRN